MRDAAAEALGEIGDARAVEPLIAALKDGDWDVRQFAAKALGKIGDARAVEPLIATLKDSNKDVCKKAADALDEVGWQAGKDEVSAAYWIGKQNWGECVKLGALAVEPLIAALTDSESGASIRDSAAKALGKIGDARAVEPLIAALKDSDWNVRGFAAKALINLGALAVEPLIVALKHSNKDVRSGAAKALGKIGDARAVEPLIATLKDSDVHTYPAAAYALDEFGWQAGKDEVSAAYWIGKQNWGECVKLGAVAVEPLIVSLKVDHPYVRMFVAEILGQMGDPRAVEPLIAALTDSESGASIRDSAAKALGKIGDARAVEPLIAALKDSNWNVRKKAAEALVKLYGSGNLGADHKHLILARTTKGDGETYR